MYCTYYAYSCTLVYTGIYMIVYTVKPISVDTPQPLKYGHFLASQK